MRPGHLESSGRLGEMCKFPSCHWVLIFFNGTGWYGSFDARADYSEVLFRNIYNLVKVCVRLVSFRTFFVYSQCTAMISWTTTGLSWQLGLRLRRSLLACPLPRIPSCCWFAPLTICQGWLRLCDRRVFLNNLDHCIFWASISSLSYWKTDLSDQLFDFICLKLWLLLHHNVSGVTLLLCFLHNCIIAKKHGAHQVFFAWDHFQWDNFKRTS